MAEKNAIGVALGNGRFYTMQQNKKPYKITNFGYPEMRLNLIIEFTDGTTQRIASDEKWKLNADGAIRSANEYDGEIYDAIAGPFLIVGLGDEDFISLSDDLIEKYRDIFAQPEVFIRTNSGLLVMPYVTDDFTFSSADEMER
jgi:hypothetical protein